MVEGHARIAGGVAGQAGRILIHVTVHPRVGVVGFRVDVTAGTRVFRVIRWVGMAIRACRPLPLVLATVDREVGRVVF